MSTVVSLARTLRDLDRDRQTLLWFALLYALSGVVHLVVWAIDGGAWAGDVSWRKPIVFGFSGAVTTASLVWALGAVRPGPARRRGVMLYVWTMTLEIALIDMQRWRGVASHFNDSTLFDMIVFQVMGALILAASLPVLRWAIAVGRDRELPAERRVAVAAGLWLLVVGIGIGITIAPLGTAGRMMHDARVVSAARGLVLAHAVALHGIQVMGAAAWLLPRFVSHAADRVVWLRRAALGTLALTLVAATLGVMS